VALPGQLGLAVSSGCGPGAALMVATVSPLVRLCTAGGIMHGGAPVSGGTVRAVAVPVHRGRTTVTAETSVFDTEDRLVAQTVQVQAVR
jgi:hypothetical protein